MGKAVIVSSDGDGLYSIDVVYDRERIDKEKARLSAEISSLESSISDATQELGEAQSEASSAISQLDAIIRHSVEGNQVDYESAIKDFGDANKRLVAARVKLNALRADQSAMISRLAELSGVPASERRNAWCADYVESLEPGLDVGTIEIPGEPTNIVIRPAHDGAAEYSPERDGILRPRIGCDSAQAFFNACMLPGWQKWIFPYRVGEITEMDSEKDTATVLMDREISSAQSLVVQEQESSAGLNIEYMDCNGYAFEIGDRVIVDTKEGKVIGFESEPRPCGPDVIFARRELHDDGTGYISYGARILILKSNGDESRVVDVYWENNSTFNGVTMLGGDPYILVNWNESTGVYGGALVGDVKKIEFPNDQDGSHGISPKSLIDKIYDISPDQKGYVVRNGSLQIEKYAPFTADYWVELWVDHSAVIMMGWMSGGYYQGVVIDRDSDTILGYLDYPYDDLPSHVTATKELIAVCHWNGSAAGISFYDRSDYSRLGFISLGGNSEYYSYSCELSGKYLYVARGASSDVDKYTVIKSPLSLEFLGKINMGGPGGNLQYGTRIVSSQGR